MKNDNLLTVTETVLDSGRRYQERRHPQWDDNYTLYRDIFRIDKIKRQPINVPLLKATIKTLQAKQEEIPDVVFKDLLNNEEKEIIIKEMWRMDMERINIEGIDTQDKKNEHFYGRTFKKLNFINGKFEAYALDIYDVLIDPKVNPIDIQGADYLIHQNIFINFNDVFYSGRYDMNELKKLKGFTRTQEGTAQHIKNSQASIDKDNRMRELGYSVFDEMNTYDNLVALKEFYINLWNQRKKKFVRHLVVTADDRFILLNKPLKEVIGINKLPFVSWASDLETLDFWSDGSADSIRNINQVQNIWISQLVENRTLRNMNMFWFDSTTGSNPQTFNPYSNGMYPIEGNPSQVILPIQFPALTDSINEMQYLTGMAETVTSATSIEKGVGEIGPQTATEVELLVQKSSERHLASSKFYRRAWKDFAKLWYEIVRANVPYSKVVKLSKAASDGEMFTINVTKKDWESKEFDIRVLSSSEEKANSTEKIQKLMIAKQQFPENRNMQKIVGKEILKLAGLTPEQISSIEEEEETKLQFAQGLGQQVPQGQGGILAPSNLAQQQVPV